MQPLMEAHKLNLTEDSVWLSKLNCHTSSHINSTEFLRGYAAFGSADEKNP